MVYIITSKTRSKYLRKTSYSIPSTSQQGSANADMVRKHGAGQYSKQAREQYAKVSAGNKEEFRQEKRIVELHKKGFNEAAITGMMFTGKETGKEGHVKSVIRKQKGRIKTDGNL